MAVSGFEVGSLNLPFIAVAAGTAVTNQPVIRTRRKIRVDAIRLGTQETVTADATDYASMSIMNGTTTIGHLSTVTSAGGTLTSGVFKAFTLVSANTEIASAQSVVFKLAHAGSGTAIATPVLQMEYSIVD